MRNEFPTYYALSSITITPGFERINPLSLHDALPIFERQARVAHVQFRSLAVALCNYAPNFRHAQRPELQDRKSTRLNSSHVEISYAVFCLKKKNTNDFIMPPANGKGYEIKNSSTG